MTTCFYEEIKGIYRLRVPFEAIYTSVFLILTSSGAFLVDCASTDEDVDRYIIPSLRKMELELSDIKALILTHKHRDHAGGLSRILSLMPNMNVVTDVRALCNEVCTYPMAGHTEDCIGILDMRSHTLITADGLQGAGVDKYRCSIKNCKEYMETIKRLQNDKRIENLLFSHAYEPWNRDSIIGRSALDICLSECIKYSNGGIK